MLFSKEILMWYRLNKRDLPWRNSKNPYTVWLSEIILQQTRVNQGLSYYLKFVSRFPTVKKLAEATEEEILKLWQGLGYYSRARNLHFAAKQVENEFNGSFPKQYKDIIKLKGVGEYTAAAISSICHNEPQPVIDGNVYRVLSRYFGITTPIDSTEGKKTFKKIAEKCLDKKNSGEYNQAIMEYGALKCTPKNPDCENCKLNNSCFAFTNTMVNELPFKQKKAKQKQLYFYYLLIKNGSNIFIEQRKGKGIWENLYQFPLIEKTTKQSLDTIINSKDWKKILSSNKFEIENVSESNKHILSHRIIFPTFIVVRLENEKEIIPYKKIPISNFNLLPIPRLIHKFIEENPIY